MAIAKVSDCLDRRRLGFPKPNQAAASLYSRGLEGEGNLKGSGFDADQCTCTAKLMHARPVSRSLGFFQYSYVGNVVFATDTRDYTLVNRQLICRI